MSTQNAPVMPAYGGACITNVVPELIKAVMGRPTAAWVPPVVMGAKQIVLLVLDGLGWEQLQARKALAPTLTGFDGGRITTVAPSTTAAALTSLVTSRPPSVHGVVGYRVSVGDHGVMNVLSWRTDHGDMRETVVPRDFQVHPAFAANPIPAVTQRRFLGSGFTEAHMQGARVIGYSVPSSLVVETWRMINAGESLVYAYYSGIDEVSHAEGLGEHWDAEMYTADRLVRDLVAGLPEGAALVVTSDHGQVQVGGRTLDIEQEIVDKCWRFSGEGRFRWLHVHEGQHDEALEACRRHYGELAWVVTRQEVSEQGWFGGPIDDHIGSRLGDVALIPFAPVAFKDPTHKGESSMQTRHGSLTSAEMYVPLLAKRV